MHPSHRFYYKVRPLCVEAVSRLTRLLVLSFAKLVGRGGVSLRNIALLDMYPCTAALHTALSVHLSALQKDTKAHQALTIRGHLEGAN